MKAERSGSAADQLHPVAVGLERTLKFRRPVPIRDWFRVHMPLLQWKGRSLTEVLTPQMQADFYHFEGNTQALRLVTKLHYLVDAHGMNLTKALLGRMSWSSKGTS